MTSSHQFGGHWTDDKLERLKEYLSAYLKIFKTNPRAQYFNTTFVDAFAGTGYRNITTESSTPTLPLSIEGIPIYDDEARSFQKGSAQIAIELEPSFDKYLFVEKNPTYAQELVTLRDRFPKIASKINIIQGEANTTLQTWCQQTNWRKNRAVVFLDPYGMEVEWKTIVALGQTQAVDLWILFPLGQAINRILTKSGPPTGVWADRLTKFFGTENWQEAFYQREVQLTLFGEEETIKKSADFEQIGNFFLKQLATVFAQVADNPLYLRNSKNVPIYLLCFAAANKRGAPTAVKIAEYILGR